MSTTKTLASCAVFGLLAVPGARAQTAPAQRSAPATQPATPAPIIPLKIQVTISTFRGDNKVSSRPYTLAVNANDTGPTRRAELTDGTQILIPMVTVNEKTTGPVYKDVGTSINCAATAIDGGRFKVELSVEDASVYPEDKLPADGARGPWLQTVRSSQTLLLKDGQSMEYSTATDKVTGDVTRLSVMLAVVK